MEKKVKKPYWKVEVTKTATYDSSIYIKSWKQPNSQDIENAIEETIKECDWNNCDTDYDWNNIVQCESDEAVAYDIYDPNPDEPEEKIEVINDVNQLEFNLGVINEKKH